MDITPFINTETDRFNKLIETGNVSKERLIMEYIEKHDTKKMLEGVKYYYKENDITKRPIYKYDNEGNKTIDHEATNNKLASGWHKLLVDQKTSYLVGDPVAIGSKTDKDIQPIVDLLGDDFDDVLPELVTAASNKGREWLHPYIDEEGEFDYIIIPAQEFIPLYDNTKRKNLDGGIRYYYLDDDTLKVELWDKEQVTYYEESNGGLVLDMSYEENPQSHFRYGNNGYGWGWVPFIEFANNNKRVSDLLFYKDFIDIYDNLMSDTSNTLEDIQRFLYVIKGYEGTDLNQAVTNFKRFRGVAVGEEGGVDILQGEVPMDSINSYLDRLVEDIYAQGQGVNTNTDKFGASPSGIALKFLFSLLDMKANVLERKFTKGLKEFMWFVTEYLRISGKGTFDYTDLTFTFNKSMLMNDFETVQIAQMSKGLVSDDTIVANHPWVTSAQVEMERLQGQYNDTVDLDEDDVDE